MCKINKSKPFLRLVFVMLEFKDDIWSFSAKILNFLGKNCKMKKNVEKEEKEIKSRKKQKEDFEYCHQDSRKSHIQNL